MESLQRTLLCQRPEPAAPPKPPKYRRLPGLRRGTLFLLSALMLSAPTTTVENPGKPLALFSQVMDEGLVYSLNREPFAVKLPSLSPSVPSDGIDFLTPGIEIPANARPGTALLFPMEEVPSPDPVKAITLAPTSDAGYTAYGGIYIKNTCGKTVDIASYLARPLSVQPMTQEPQVLIYHTHTHEGYTPTELDSFTLSQGDRCDDSAYSVVRVGAEIADVLRANGIQVIHDTGVYDTLYSGAYGRSLDAVKSYLEQYPSIQIAIDVHRDALNEPDNLRYKLVAEVDGQQVAQVMMLVGTDGDGNTPTHSGWESNFCLALQIQAEMNRTYPTLARPMKLTAGAYNQYTTPGSLLLEVGANGNTLSEAIAGGRLFAQSLVTVLSDT